jgi:hypothetical protein
MARLRFLGPLRWMARVRGNLAEAEAEAEVCMALGTLGAVSRKLECRSFLMVDFDARCM